MYVKALLPGRKRPSWVKEELLKEYKALVISSERKTYQELRKKQNLES